jgi:transketolase
MSLKKTQKLNPNIFKDGVEMIPIRNGYGEGLLEAGEKDKRIVALCADLTESTRTKAFADKFPDRFIQIGVAEQNLATVASGMAAMGKIPFITSYSMFSPGRNWEQIRTTICYNDRPVKIIGSHAGVSVGPDGGTHQALEDIAIMRVIPNMVVIVPCDSIEAKKATLAAAETNTPVYIRLAREKTPIVTTNESPFEIGKSQVLFEAKVSKTKDKDSNDKKIGIIVCGGIVHNALVAAHELEEEGIKVSVLNLSTIKPLDEKGILDFAKKHESIITVEEHQVAGGMGSAIAEFLAKNYPTPINFLGVQDTFGQSGTPNELIKHYGLGVASIKKAILQSI